MLNARRTRFVAEYLIDLNAKRAAIRAGYSPKTAHAIGHALLRIVEVTAAIEKGQKALAAESYVTAERIVGELAKLGFANMADFMKSNDSGDPYLDFSGLTRDQAAALAEVTVEDFVDGRSDKREVRRVKFKLCDKRAALVDLGRHLGMFKDEVKVSVDSSVVGLMERIASVGRRVHDKG